MSLQKSKKQPTEKLAIRVRGARREPKITSHRQMVFRVALAVAVAAGAYRALPYVTTLVPLPATPAPAGTNLSDPVYDIVTLDAPVASGLLLRILHSRLFGKRLLWTRKLRCS